MKKCFILLTIVVPFLGCSNFNHGKESSLQAKSADMKRNSTSKALYVNHIFSKDVMVHDTMRNEIDFKTFYSIAFHYFCHKYSVAQNPKQRVYGTVFDTISNKKIAFATLRLFQNNSDSLVQGTISDTTGFFQVDNIKNGIYTLKVDLIGYKQKSIKVDLTNVKKSVVVWGKLCCLWIILN